MTVTETSLDAEIAELFDQDAALKSVGLGDGATSPSAAKRTDSAPPLLDIADIRDAMKLLNGDRIQPNFDADGREIEPAEQRTIGGCVNSVPATGRPSCIAGTLLAILAPQLFADAIGWNGSVDGVAGIEDVFTERAIRLMRRMQNYADGVVDDRKRPWGEAFREAALDRLSNMTTTF